MITTRSRVSCSGDRYAHFMAQEHRTIDRFTAARNELLDLVLQRSGDERVRSAIRRVPRHEFVPPELVADAYKNVALPIGDGQTISQPLIVQLKTITLQVCSSDRMLEIGVGPGTRLRFFL